MVDQFEEKKLEERILLIKRVTKKITGGSHITFVAVVAVGDRKGKVGIGMGKGREVPQAIRKAFTKAQKKMITIPVYKGTIPHEVFLKYKAGVVFLKLFYHKSEIIIKPVSPPHEVPPRVVVHDLNRYMDRDRTLPS